MPDLQHLLHGSLESVEGIAPMWDGTETLVGMLTVVTDAAGEDVVEPLQ